MAAFERRQWPGNPAKKVRREAPDGVTRRLYRRIDLRLPARFQLPSGEDRPCIVRDLSVRSASVLADTGAMRGDRLILRVPDFGPLEGRVLRTGNGGFVLILGGGRKERQRRADLLTVFLNEGTGEGRAVRFPLSGESILETGTGQVAHAYVTNVSATGVQIRTALFPALGETVLIGRKKARVVRHDADGIAVAFTRPQPHS